MRASFMTVLILGGLGGLAAQARADVLVVDGAPGAGHFATIQSAVDAAAAGDTILVDVTWDTSSQDVVIDGKGVNLLSDTPLHSGNIHKLVIRNVPAGQRASVAGFFVVNAAGVAMECSDNAGALRLYDIGAKGKKGQPQTATSIARPGSTGGIITDCADVVMRKGGLGGGDGGDVLGNDILATSDGGIGLVVTNSKLSCFFSPCSGGPGGDVFPVGSTVPGGAGGTGIVSVNSTLFFFGQVGVGGSGGGTQHAVGGSGGTGLVQSGPGAALFTFNAAALGGAGGHSFGSAKGPDGAAQLLLGGTAAELASPPSFARDVSITTPVREGEAVSITATGFNDDVFAILSLDPGHQLLPGFQGVLTVGAPFLGNLLSLGHISIISKTFPLGPAPQLPAGLGALEVHVQGVVKTGGGPFTLAAPDHVVLLDAAY